MRSVYPLGVADAIADVVETGRTLTQAGLKVVGEPLLESEAVVVTGEKNQTLSAPLQVCIERLKGIVVAREYVMIEYDAPKHLLDKACAITPGIESPTISPLSKPDWVAVKAMVKSKTVNSIMDELASTGCKRCGCDGHPGMPAVAEFKKRPMPVHRPFLYINSGARHVVCFIFWKVQTG